VALAFCQISHAAIGQLADWNFEQSAWPQAQNITLNANSSSSTLVSGTPTLNATENSSQNKVAQVTGTGTDTTLVMNMGGGGSQNGDNFILELTAGSGGFNNAFTIGYKVWSQNTDANHINQMSWSYSVNDGGSYSSPVVDTITAGNQTWQSFTVDFNSITVAANSDIWFRAVLGTGTSGNNVRVDDIIVTAVPEPINAALAILGLGFAVVEGGRRVCRRLQT
jgi:hypothetical protein